MLKSADFLATLSAIVGCNNLFSTPDDLTPFLTDWRGRYHGRALALARPGNTTEIAAIVRACAAANVPIVPQGGNTGLVGGATPDATGAALLLQLGRLRRCLTVDSDNAVMTVEAGMTLAAVQAAAEAAGCLFPLSLASAGSCQIGGNLATNAGGVHVLRYGMMRDLVLGVEAVLPNGELWQGLSGLRKNTAGYDLGRLLVGSEGTLGIITAASLKLFARPGRVFTFWLGIASPSAAVTLLTRLRAAFDFHLTAFELICPLAFALVQKHCPHLPCAPGAPWHVLCELSASGIEAADTGGDEASFLGASLQTFFTAREAAGEVLAVWPAASTRARSHFWRWRESISEAQKREGISIKHDIALPASRVVEFLSRVEVILQARFPGIRHTAYGHLGDGNLHFNLSMPDAVANAALLAYEEEANLLVYDLVAAMGGTIAAEHGIGQLKRELLCRYRSPAEIAAFSAIKSALDPQNILNPGKVLRIG
jgi:FAD/FMN-containing dehydrogenase